MLIGAGGAVVAAGIPAAVASWIKARAKATEAEGTAKARALTAEAEVDHELAATLTDIRTRLAAAEAAEERCQADRVADRAACDQQLQVQKQWTADEIAKLQKRQSDITGRISVLENGKPT